MNEVMIAFEESVKLQSHYAELLNMHDRGHRLAFKSAAVWIERLRKIGTLSPNKSLDSDAKGPAQVS